jgi:hypothetical protein
MSKLKGWTVCGMVLLSFAAGCLLPDACANGKGG